MWISRQMKKSTPTADADLGMTTISGERSGVLTRGEVRALPIYGPGGYLWMPENGDRVLVMKGGPGGEEPCVAGMQQPAAPGEMRPGEVCLRSGDCTIYLKRDGTVRLQGGKIEIEGELWINGRPYAPCTCGDGGDL